jgi:hypothetical protein
MKTIKLLIVLTLVAGLAMLGRPVAATARLCPCGNLIAKFEWDGNSFLPEGDANGITITAVTDNQGEPISVDWVSSQWLICAVVVKHGTGSTNEIVDPPDDNGTSLTYLQNAISHIEFCGDEPTFAEEIIFDATPANGRVVLEWTAISEEDVLGYNILRKKGIAGTFEQINDNLIAGKGSIETTVEYEYFDEDVQNGRRYFYKLEEVETDGDTKEHGPVKAVPRLIYEILD